MGKCHRSQMNLVDFFMRACKQPWDLAWMRVPVCYLAVHMLSSTVLPANRTEDKWLGYPGYHDIPVLLE